MNCSPKTSKMPQEDLFKEFKKASTSEWRQQIDSELKETNFDKTLVWESPEGIKVRPFYHSEDLENSKVFPYGKRGRWKICQTIHVNDAEEANVKALDTISRGAECILFIILSENILLEKLLNGIAQEISIHFDFKFLSPTFFKRIQVKNKDVFLNLDCIGNFARTGNWFSGEEEDFKILKPLQGSGNKNIISIDISLYQNAGANIVQQLAYAIGHVNEYFTRGIIDSTITFKASVGSNYFFEIAKLRALRWLFKILADEYDLSMGCHIIAEPSVRNKTIYDYNANMLRTTTESMAAILGGADTVCNLAYDFVYHKPNEFGERIARNQLLVLKNESHFSQVYNPADGSYYIETLTEELAADALQKFKKIESDGGFLKLLKEGIIQKEIAQSSSIEQKKFDTRELVLVGSNVYQNFDNKMKDNLEFNPFQEKKFGQTLIEPIIEKRLASDLEQKRMEDE